MAFLTHPQTIDFWESFKKKKKKQSSLMASNNLSQDYQAVQLLYHFNYFPFSDWAARVETFALSVEFLVKNYNLNL